MPKRGRNFEAVLAHKDTDCLNCRAVFSRTLLRKQPPSDQPVGHAISAPAKRVVRVQSLLSLKLCGNSEDFASCLPTTCRFLRDGLGAGSQVGLVRVLPSAA